MLFKMAMVTAEIVVSGHVWKVKFMVKQFMKKYI